ncbi:MAG: YfhO family protein, partial [Candidatus Binatia bacterium]
YYPSGGNLHPSFFLVQGRPPFKEAVALFFSNLLPNEGIFYGFDYFQEIDALARRPYTEFLGFANQLETAAQIRLLRTFNVQYLVSFQPLAVSGTTLVGHFPQYFSWLYKIDRTVPRTYVVNKSIEEKNSAQVLRRLASPAFDPMHEVVLDRPVKITSQRELVATAKIVRYEHQAVTIQASLNDSGILVLADSYYPGWKAYVDGIEARILKANHFFRAVVLPQGEHVVEFKYEPLSFKIGLIVSLATGLCILMISVGVFFRNQRLRRTHSKES